MLLSFIHVLNRYISQMNTYLYPGKEFNHLRVILFYLGLICRAALEIYGFKKLLKVTKWKLTALVLYYYYKAEIEQGRNKRVIGNPKDGLGLKYVSALVLVSPIEGYFYKEITRSQNLKHMANDFPGSNCLAIGYVRQVIMH